MQVGKAGNKSLTGSRALHKLDGGSRTTELVGERQPRVTVIGCNDACPPEFVDICCSYPYRLGPWH